VALEAVALLSVVPLQKIQLVVVHQQQDGYSWVSTTKPSTLTLGRSEAQIKESIGNYLRLRESYHPETYRENAQLVKYFSSSSVEHGFLTDQNANDALTVVLGKNAFRTVQIESIQLLSAEKDRVSILPTKNMALVRFTLLDKDMDGKIKNTTHEQAFVTYIWIGEPENPELKLLNYDGFTITSYEKTTVNAFNNSPSSINPGEKTA
jgi:type IV secretory pathway component VirB8